MKIRNGFVSNSSSSSFIVISLDGGYSKELNWEALLEYSGGPMVVNYSFGKTDFGWGPEKISDTPSKIIFSYLRAQYADRNSWIEMLEKVIKEHTKCSEIKWVVGIDEYEDHVDFAYIDHQSVEGEANTEMFNDEYTLSRFLFCPQSCIQLDNDNH